MSRKPKQQPLAVKPMTMKMLPAKAGTCSVCATDHGELMGHNYWSLFYRMHFKMRYGRDATHVDTVAHLSDKDEKLWRSVVMPALNEHGLEWTEPVDPAKRVAEPYAVNE